MEGKERQEGIESRGSQRLGKKGTTAMLGSMGIWFIFIYTNFSNCIVR